MATRFYFPGSETAAVAPTISATWQYTSEYVSRRLSQVKSSSAIAAGSQIGPWTVGNSAIDRQYISDPLAAGIVFNSGVTIKGQLMVREFAPGDNTDRIITGIRIVSNDGGTVQATCLAVSSYATSANFINNATMRNKKIADGDALTSNYTTVAGDRLCIELGYSDDTAGATPEGSAKWGENATDLPEDETQTTNGAGWIEFSNTIGFFVNPAVLVFTGQPGCQFVTPARRTLAFMAIIAAAASTPGSPNLFAEAVPSIAPNQPPPVRVVPATFTYVQTSAGPGLAASDLPTPTFPGWLPYAPPAPPVKVRTYHQNWTNPPPLALLPAPNPWLQPQPAHYRYASVKTYYQHSVDPPLLQPASPNLSWIQSGPAAPPVRVKTYHQTVTGPYTAPTPAPDLSWLQGGSYAGRSPAFSYVQNATNPVDLTLTSATATPIPWLQNGPPATYARVNTYYQQKAEPLTQAPLPPAFVPAQHQQAPPVKVRTYSQDFAGGYSAPPAAATIAVFPQPTIAGQARTFTYVQVSTAQVDLTLLPSASPSDPANWYQGGPPPRYARVRTYHQASADAPGPVNAAPSPSEPRFWYQGGPVPLRAKVRTYHQETTPPFFDLTTPYFEQLPQPKYKRPSWRYIIQDRAEALSTPPTPAAFAPAQQPQGVPRIAKVRTYHQDIAQPYGLPVPANFFPVQQPQGVPPIVRVKTYHQETAHVPGQVNAPAAPSDPALWFQGGPPPRYAKVKTYHQELATGYPIPAVADYVPVQQPQTAAPIKKVKTYHQAIAEVYIATPTPAAYVPIQQHQVSAPIARVKTHHQFIALPGGPLNAPSNVALWFQGGPPPLYAKVRTYHQTISIPNVVVPVAAVVTHTCPIFLLGMT